MGVNEYIYDLPSHTKNAKKLDFLELPQYGSVK
jgi:hypothetical protein